MTRPFAKLWMLSEFVFNSCPHKGILIFTHTLYSFIGYLFTMSLSYIGVYSLNIQTHNFHVFMM